MKHQNRCMKVGLQRVFFLKMGSCHLKYEEGDGGTFQTISIKLKNNANIQFNVVIVAVMLP